VSYPKHQMSYFFDLQPLTVPPSLPRTVPRIFAML